MKQSDALKLERLRKQKQAQKSKPTISIEEQAIDRICSVLAEKINALKLDVTGSIPEPELIKPKLDEINSNLINLIESLTKGLNINNIDEARVKKLEIANQIKIPQDIATNQAVKGIADSITQNSNVIKALATALEKKSQQPEDFIPVRRVYKAGNRFLFDDTSSGSYSGGGGGTTVINSSSSETVYSVNDIEEGTTSYYGFTASDGTWQVRKITDTLVSYATASNNGAVTSYTDAWTNRATLTYGRYDQAF